MANNTMHEKQPIKGGSGLDRMCNEIWGEKKKQLPHALLVGWHQLSSGNYIGKRNKTSSMNLL